MSGGRSRFLVAVVVGCWVGVGVGVGGIARADLFETYANVEVFELPAGTSVFNVVSDGRIVALVGGDVYIEDTAGGRSFSLVGTLPSADIPFFGAAFMAVSPDGSRVAVGNNGGASFVDFQVGVFDIVTLAGDWVAANHFLGRWMDNERLFLVAGGSSNVSSVTVLDTTDSDPANWTITTVIENIGGASGGIALDGAGNLFTANGFSTTGPSGTGAVKAFAAADWMAALSGGGAVDFENGGVLIVDILSGNPLAFDVEGNLLVGGGDSAPDDDAIAIVRASAVADALAAVGPVNVNDPLAVRRVDPILDNDFNFFECETNLVLGEFYVRDFGAGTVFVYRDLADVPAMGEWGAVWMSLGLMSAATVVMRRRTAEFAVAA